MATKSTALSPFLTCHGSDLKGLYREHRELRTTFGPWEELLPDSLRPKHIRPGSTRDRDVSKSLHAFLKSEGVCFTVTVTQDDGKGENDGTLHCKASGVLKGGEKFDANYHTPVYLDNASQHVSRLMKNVKNGSIDCVQFQVSGWWASVQDARQKSAISQNILDALAITHEDGCDGSTSYADELERWLQAEVEKTVDYEYFAGPEGIRK